MLLLPADGSLYARFCPWPYWCKDPLVAIPLFPWLCQHSSLRNSTFKMIRPRLSLHSTRDTVCLHPTPTNVLGSTCACKPHVAGLPHVITSSVEALINMRRCCRWKDYTTFKVGTATAESHVQLQQLCTTQQLHISVHTTAHACVLRNFHSQLPLTITSPDSLALCCLITAAHPLDAPRPHQPTTTNSTIILRLQAANKHC